MTRTLQALLACVLVLFVSPAWGAVAWDAVATSQLAVAGTTDSYTHTIGAGTNNWVGVCVASRTATNNNVTDVDVGAVQATELSELCHTTGGADICISFWGAIMGSATGAHTVAATWTETDRPRIHSFSMNGVDQSTPTGTAQEVEVTSTSITDDVTSATDELVIACRNIATSSSAWADGAGETQRWLTDDSVANNQATLGSTEPGGATVTMSATWTTSNYAIQTSVDVNIAAAAATGHRSPIRRVF